jgi:hypothetical protein
MQENELLQKVYGTMAVDTATYENGPRFVKAKLE